jgi:hypothetical protein
MRSDPTFCLLAGAPEINDPRAGETKLVGNACWASFAVWKSNAGVVCPPVTRMDATLERTLRRPETESKRDYGEVYINLAPQRCEVDKKQRGKA